MSRFKRSAHLLQMKVTAKANERKVKRNHIVSYCLYNMLENNPCYIAQGILKRTTRVEHLKTVKLIWRNISIND